MEPCVVVMRCTEKCQELDPCYIVVTVKSKVYIQDLPLPDKCILNPESARHWEVQDGG